MPIKNKYSDVIAGPESGGDYRAHNETSGARGKHQFLWGDKTSWGWGPKILEVAEEMEYNIKTPDDFLNNSDFQEVFFDQIRQ